MHKPIGQMTRDERIAFALRNVDTKDLEWLRGIVGDGGHGQFWKAVIRELDSALRCDVLSSLTKDTGNADR